MDLKLIPGIYHYCDRRCGPCAFTRRCFHYLEERKDWPGAARNQGFTRMCEDPLAVLADSCTDATLKITERLEEVLPFAEPVVQQAAAAVEYLSPIIVRKTRRALARLLEADCDSGHAQDEANGTAKLTRLMIKDSIDAWQVLMVKGEASHDGVPAQLVGMLRQLDAGLAERFPLAMEFRRPGFDDDAAS